MAEFSGQDSIVRAAQRYIECNLSRPIRVADVAASAYTHRSNLYRIFKERLHTTVECYIADVRMERAAALLIDSAMGIAEIAERIGVGTPYLSRRFKEKFGCSPSRFRKRAGN